MASRQRFIRNAARRCARQAEPDRARGCTPCYGHRAGGGLDTEEAQWIADFSGRGSRRGATADATLSAQLAHYPRYLKAIAARLDKLKADPARDAARTSEIAPLQTALLREVAARKGVVDPRLEEFRWLLEELRVSLYAQELRTPVPVSAKRLSKAWE